MKTLQDIQPFADLFGAQQKARLIADGMNWELHSKNHTISVKMASKYARWRARLVELILWDLQ